MTAPLQHWCVAHSLAHRLCSVKHHRSQQHPRQQQHRQGAHLGVASSSALASLDDQQGHVTCFDMTATAAAKHSAAGGNTGTWCTCYTQSRSTTLSIATHVLPLPAPSQVEDLLQQRQPSAVVMAYGVTNAGKTYTMQGAADRPGLVPQALEHVFKVGGVQALECCAGSRTVTQAKEHCEGSGWSSLTGGGEAGSWRCMHAQALLIRSACVVPATVTLCPHRVDQSCVAPLLQHAVQECRPGMKVVLSVMEVSTGSCCGSFE
jgi:hypothetical protein